jgi:hypothetical protein
VQLGLLVRIRFGDLSPVFSQFFGKVKFERINHV